MLTTVLVIFAATAIAVIFIYNSLVALNNQVQNAWRQIDVQLKRRHDLIPNLVETVRGAMQFERDTLERVIAARASAVGAVGIAQRAAAEAALGQSLGRLLAVMENYPDLKANANALRLQEELTTTENQITFTRQFYNDSVMQWNTRRQTIPVNLVAGLFHFPQAEYFQAAEVERQTPRVDLTLGK